MSGDWSVEQVGAVEALARLLPSSVDLVLTDPAYESLERHRKHGTTTRLKQSEGSSNEWFPIFPNAQLPDLLRGMYRVLKPERHSYVLCDEETADIVKVIAEETGFYVWKTLVWVKTLSASVGEPVGDRGTWTAAGVAAAQVRRGMGYHFAASTERIVFLEKRSAPYVRAAPPGMFGGSDRFAPKKDPPGRGRKVMGGECDVLFAPRVTGYPTEKPVNLLRKLVWASTEHGELVVDPFCGSGSTGEAAVGLGRRVKLYDVADKAIATTTARMNALGGT